LRPSKSELVFADEDDEPGHDLGDLDDRVRLGAAIAVAEQLAFGAGREQQPRRRQTGRVTRELREHVLVNEHGVADLQRKSDREGRVIRYVQHARTITARSDSERNSRPVACVPSV